MTAKLPAPGSPNHAVQLGVGAEPGSDREIVMFGPCGKNRPTTETEDRRLKTLSKAVEPHEVRIEAHLVRSQYPAPVWGHRHVPVDPRHPKSEPAHSSHPLIAEPVYVNRVEVGVASDEHYPGARERPQKGPNALEHQFPLPPPRRGASPWIPPVARFAGGRSRENRYRPSEILPVGSRRCESFGWLGRRRERSAKCLQSLPRVSTQNRASARQPTMTQLRPRKVRRSAGADVLHPPRRDRRRRYRRRPHRTRSVRRPGPSTDRTLQGRRAT